MTSAHWADSAAPALVISGDGPKPASVTLTGARARTVAKLTGRGKTWTATLPLTASRWGSDELPLPAGDYRVDVTPAADGALPEEPRPLPLMMFTGLRAELRGWTLSVGAPIEPAYDTVEGQNTLIGRYATHSGVVENAVFFESFYGRNVSCNPRALDREIARLAPNVTRYWSVVDHSVAVPDGAIAVIEGSPEWWRARGAARLLIVNDWLRRTFVRRQGQQVLQTWHGTPIKRLALHRPGFDPRRAVAVVRESRRWNVLLAQNPAAGRILKKAYAFLTRPIWVEGYPRNDVLTTGDAASIRARLGIAPNDRVLLYAPTWRDDREQIVDFVDAEKLASDTGAVVLVRGHSRTLQPGHDVAGARVIDVTGYPDTAELMLAADALITDYSSVMFDFTVTGKPLYFLVPDLEHYRGELRGFYFDLRTHAPGVVVQTQAELTAALAAEPSAEIAERYAVWRQRFNARDDGHAAERVVARIFDQGMLDRG